ncbi:aminopeptidase P family protein [Paraclostridium sordellii]|uniref:aminopeptidase P family protein n=1 Tax=Paraclostridium sordellii TaxID=1505 RepID=UPI0012D7624F
MMIRGRIESLRNHMKEEGIDAYIIPSSDNHQSEYVGEFFKSRAYISGFTGSAGTLVVTMEEAGLWTDGRYFIQAESQLRDTGIKLFKMGEEGVPTTEEYIVNTMKENSVLGFDGRLISAKEGNDLKEKLSSKNVSIKYEYDLVDKVWEDRPSLSGEKAFLLNIKYAGETFSSKLKRLREEMQLKGANVHVITTLDDIAWLFNIRGRDVKYTPVVLSYALITLDEVYLFINEDKLNEEIITELSKENVIIKPYDSIYEFVKSINLDEKILLDENKVSYSIYNNLPREVKKINGFNPTMNFKAVKNNIELENIRNSHLKDGVAFTKFMYWLKTNIGKIEISEISASEKLKELRREQEGFIEPSFATIAGYRDHAAMMHYSATKESDYKLEAKDLFLIDSGGQYYDGTTDITRTIALGEISSELKKHFTAVVRGMIDLSMAKFLYGVKGYNLDILARRPMWNIGLDYKCGTGHGVGFLGTIHEAPNGFRWRINPQRLETATLEEGMVTTNEPGIYIEGSHGIRIENELITKKAEKNEYGQFMEFEVVTFAPIDIDAIDVNDLNREEREYLNNYHKLVYKKISPYLEEDEVQWLKNYTKEI